MIRIFLERKENGIRTIRNAARNGHGTSEGYAKNGYGTLREKQFYR